MDIALIKLELFKCLESPAPAHALNNWWQKHILQVGLTTYIDLDFKKEIKEEFKRYKAHQDEAAAHKIGQALYDAKAISREADFGYNQEIEEHRVYVLVKDVQQTPVSEKELS